MKTLKSRLLITLFTLVFVNVGCLESQQPAFAADPKTTASQQTFKNQIKGTNVTWQIDNDVLRISGGTLPNDPTFTPNNRSHYGFPAASKTIIEGKLHLVGNAGAYMFYSSFGPDPLNGYTFEGLENIDTSKATDLSGMFVLPYYIYSLDLSSFDTTNVTNMTNMIPTNAVKVLTLGPKFHFLPNMVPVRAAQVQWNNSLVTSYAFNKWRAVSDGTYSKPNGTRYMPDAFMAHYANEGVPKETYVAYVQPWIYVNNSLSIKNGDKFNPKDAFDSVLIFDSFFYPDWVDEGQEVDYDYSQALQKGLTVSGADFDTTQTGPHTVTFTIDGVSKSTVVTVEAPSDQADISSKVDISLPYGSSFDPSRAFNSITKSDGTVITDYQDALKAGMTVSGVDFDTTVVGNHDVIFHYGGKEATTHVNVETDKTNLNVKPEIHVQFGSTWNPKDGFVSATDKDGNAITDFSKITIGGDTVDTSKAGTYNVTYTNGNITKTTKVLVSADKSSIKSVPEINLPIGGKWNPQDGFISATDKDGSPVTDFSRITIGGDKVDTSKAGTYNVTYSYGNKSATTKVVVSKDQTALNVKPEVDLTIGDKWQDADGFISAFDKDGKKIDFKDIKVGGDKVDTNKAGTYKVTYAYGGITKTTDVVVKAKVTPNPVNPTPNPKPTPTPTNPDWNPSNPNNPNGTGLPNYAAVKGSAVYATKKIYMYKHGNFKKSQRIATYPKQKRINRPMFVVTGYTRSNGGALRYKVRDVNHHSKTAGKRGYITANRKYVVRVYYQSVPKKKMITVINPKGVHAYKNRNLTKQVKHYKKGSHLRVKKIVKWNLTTRYQLTNGHYVTANKKLVIQGKY